MAEFILKHKDHDAALFDVDEDGDFNQMDIINDKEIPILGKGIKNVSEWIRERAIPENRKNLGVILREAGCITPQEYMFRNFALSLSDTYWICPADEKNIKWTDVNLYQHPTGILTFKNGLYGTSRKKVRNNSSLGGSLEKYNRYENDGWHLIKKGDPDVPSGLQNINEAFAALIHERQGFSEYTKYTLNYDSHGVCESCDCRYFTDENHELISAYNVTGGITGQSETFQDAYNEYIDECVRGGLSEDYVRHFIDYMLLTDFLITNTDRHWENFGILRNPDTLQFTSMAPIFDSGTSMVCRDPFVNSRLGLLKIGVKGICLSQQENLELIQNKNIVDISRLPSEKETVEFYVRRGIQKERAEQIASCFKMKCDMVIEFQRGLQISIGKEYEYNGNPPYKNGKENPTYEGYRNKIRFVVLCGIPDSGKEEAAKKYIENTSQTVYVRTNNIREEIGIKAGEDEKRVFTTAYSRIRQALKDRKDVIYVATNLDRKTRQKVLKLTKGISGVRKILDIVYKNPEEIRSEIPMQNLENAADILSKNKPSLSEGWDEIEISGVEPEYEHKHQLEKESNMSEEHNR